MDRLAEGKVINGTGVRRGVLAVTILLIALGRALLVLVWTVGIFPSVVFDRKLRLELDMDAVM